MCDKMKMKSHPLVLEICIDDNCAWVQPIIKKNKGFVWFWDHIWTPTLIRDKQTSKFHIRFLYCLNNNNTFFHIFGNIINMLKRKAVTRKEIKSPVRIKSESCISWRPTHANNNTKHIFFTAAQRTSNGWHTTLGKTTKCSLLQNKRTLFTKEIC